MKYKVKIYSDSMIPYTIENDKDNKNRFQIRNKSEEEFETENIEVCKHLIKDYTDVPEYSLTKENIEKNFKCTIEDRNIEQIIAYYSFRKLIYGDLLKHIKDNEVGVFRYEIPEEVNHFELRECLEDIGDFKEYSYYIELEMING